MLTVCPYFHVHQPYRVKKYRVFDLEMTRNISTTAVKQI